MQTSSGALLDLLPVLCYDVHQRLSHHAVSCDEKVDVLSAPAVEEFVMDGADGRLCIR